jgi:hypothetical protein
MPGFGGFMYCAIMGDRALGPLSTSAARNPQGLTRREFLRLACIAKGWELRRARSPSSAFSTRHKNAGTDHGSMVMLSD